MTWPARGDARRWQGLALRLRLAAGFEHPLAIRVLELELVEPRPYAVLEWVGDTSIAEAWNAGALRRPSEVIELVRALAGVLAAAHRVGLPHGRIGPAGVFLVDGNQPKLDFTGVLAGFPPEQKTEASPGDARRNSGRGFTWRRRERPTCKTLAGWSTGWSNVGPSLRATENGSATGRPGRCSPTW